MSQTSCPRCGAPRGLAPQCPRCGVPYARFAAADFAHGHLLADARSELLLAKLAAPVALLAWWVLVHTALGRFLARTFFGMWLHELGHATAAWLCGYPAIPGPWFTPMGGQRSPFLVLCIVGGLAWVAWRAWSEERRGSASLAVAVLLLQLLCSAGLSARNAQTFIVFAGDGGSLVFGAALVATFFVSPEHKLHRDWLRWGFLVIGSASFVDAFYEWWTVRGNPSLAGLGVIEGSGLTDPSRLALSGWNVPGMSSRYVGLGVLCLIALAGLQILHVRRTREALEALEE
jgi:hypothetical protein